MKNGVFIYIVNFLTLFMENRLKFVTLSYKIIYIIRSIGHNINIYLHKILIFILICWFKYRRNRNKIHNCTAEVNGGGGRIHAISPLPPFPFPPPLHIPLPVHTSNNPRREITCSVFHGSLALFPCCH